MIARQRASYARTTIGSRAHEENCQQWHDPVSDLAGYKNRKPLASRMGSRIGRLYLRM
jgi:hypothetical protein